MLALNKTSGAFAKNKQFASLAFVQNGILLNTVEAKLSAYESDGTPKVLAMGVRDRATAKDSELFVRALRRLAERAGDGS
jgi:hypothetical protein